MKMINIYLNLFFLILFVSCFNKKKQLHNQINIDSTRIETVCDNIQECKIPQNVLHLLIHDSVDFNFFVKHSKQFLKCKTLFIDSLPLNGINNFFKITSQFDSLEEIELQNISDKSISYNIGKLTKLKSLIVTSTTGFILSDSIGLCSSLRTIVLDKCTYIPSSIKNLKKLETISLLDCNLKEIPNFLFCLSDLKNVVLCNNMIEDVPSRILNFHKLKCLDLANTPIGESELNYYNNNNGIYNKLEFIREALPECEIILRSRME